MDGRRFDQWTQTLARKLGQGRGTELGAPARRLDQPAPRTAPAGPSSSGTCSYQDPAPREPGGDPHPAAAAICGWEYPQAVPATTDDPLPARTPRSARRPRAQPLSAREQQIAALIAQGLRDRQIAAALVLSEHTVHAHVRNLLAKLGVASRTQIAVWVATRAPDEQAEP